MPTGQVDEEQFLDRDKTEIHTLDDDTITRIGPMIGPMRYDGLAELWFDTADANFVNFEEATAFMTTEHLIYERPTA